MGFFSFKTSDTNRSISNSFTDNGTFTVHLITEDGRVFTEHEYEGYGTFGGKDIHTLIAEMNGLIGDTEDETRNLFFDKIWLRGITNGVKKYYHGKDFTSYDDPLESEGGFTPNQLTESYVWGTFGDHGEFSSFASEGYKVPKLVENLPTYIPVGDNPIWREYFNSLPHTESCEYQGFFY